MKGQAGSTGFVGAECLGNGSSGEAGLLGPNIQSNPKDVNLCSFSPVSNGSVMYCPFFPFPAVRGQGVGACPMRSWLEPAMAL